MCRFRSTGGNAPCASHANAIPGSGSNSRRVQPGRVTCTMKWSMRSEPIGDMEHQRSNLKSTCDFQQFEKSRLRLLPRDSIRGAFRLKIALARLISAGDERVASEYRSGLPVHYHRLLFHLLGPFY